ncbi:MAG: potassium transporter TrkH [Tistrella sp.]|uniref:Trk system potassium uptake protein n=2 Tax=Tistrella mobilis TaxID=171437 RepID=I3TQY1_TISMK|nr:MULTISPECIES: TrkH family potassium uptake protein [Tistrella]AFK55169.1 trk system potassium uptake protein TrkH [Tistrella mobilis KA081020-065]MAD36855.1 potassium transporter TrkH [Tistrella sp.]MBA79266.1 potassium transporter TrkH [Tistrella sp.]HAE47553.1 TrkH family potassium uptake protein [Tistrella mobilis]
MIDVKPVLFIIGVLLALLGATMLVPAAFDAVAASPDWSVFVVSSLVTIFAGVSLVLTTRTAHPTSLSLRHAFLTTTLSWLSVAAFAALPLLFASPHITYAGAFFESMSGLTTTGSTVLSGLDTAPPGVLIWRGMLHWLGGIGIIVTSVAIMPMLRIGGMQLFRTESSDNSEKIVPRAAQLAAAFGRVYVVMTLACMALLWAAGMTGFEALVHAMATVSTGGFSTSDASIGHFDSPLIEMIIVVFMIGGALPFVLYIRVLGQDRDALWRDTQVRAFFLAILVWTVTLSLWLVLHEHVAPLQALRVSLFNVVSVITTTGFATADYNLWGTFPFAVFFWLILVGGCTGSTSGGIKVFRFVILVTAARRHLRQLVHPNAVIVPTYNRRPVPEAILLSVLSFTTVFFAVFVVLSIVVALLGVDFITAATAVSQALANVGPGLGPIIGPAGNYATMTDPVLTVLAFAMLLGRLELFTVLVLFTRAYWRG